MLTPNNKQTGLVLTVSLIMLLLLTLIGVTSTNVTTLEEKMAGNARDQNIAFQAAEAALRGGENQIETIFNFANSFDDTHHDQGLYSKNWAALDYTSAAQWADNASAVYNVAIPLIASQPRYYIKHIISKPSDPLNPASPPVEYFRVTARGTGRQNSTQVYLQSYYGRKF